MTAQAPSCPHNRMRFLMHGEPTYRPGTIPFVPFLLSCLFLLSACAKDEPVLVKITGKTVYGGMAIEEVEVRALRWEEGRWMERGASQSGYHGSFALSVPSGRYRLEANGVIPRGPENVALGGHVDLPETAPGDRRIDRVVIELFPVPKYERSGPE